MDPCAADKIKVEVVLIRGLEKAIAATSIFLVFSDVSAEAEL